MGQPKPMPPDDIQRQIARDYAAGCSYKALRDTYPELGWTAIPLILTTHGVTIRKPGWYRTTDAGERLWARVERKEGCWLWTGSVCSSGYGTIGVGEGTTMVHRLAYELTIGPIPAGAYVIQTCGNTRCVRREHLALTTRAVTASKNGAARRKPKVQVACGCGCGTGFDCDRWRIAASRCGLVFVNQEHARRYLSGPNNPSFRGGDASYYGPGWDKARAQVRQRDTVCQDCGKTKAENARALDVHHIVAWRISRSHALDNLVLLCRRCHRLRGIAEKVAFPPPRPHEYSCTCSVCGAAFPSPNVLRTLCSPACRKTREREWNHAYWQRQRSANTPAYQKKLSRNLRRRQATREA